MQHAKRVQVAQVIVRSRLVTLLAVLLGGILQANAQATPAVRVVSLTAPAAELMYTLHAEQQLVGVADSCMFPDQIMKDRAEGRIRVVGGFDRVDVEMVEALRPDVIFTSTALQANLARQLQEKGFHVVHLDPHSLEEVITSFVRVGDAIGKGSQGKEFVAQLRSELRAIQDKARTLRPVRVYMEINHVGPWTSGSKSYVNDVIEAAGGQNIFGDVAENVFQVTNEEIRRRDPEVILSPIWIDAKLSGIDGITPLAEILSRPGFAETQAGRNSRVLYYDSALLKQGGPRQILAIRKLAHLLHPMEFSDPPDTIPWELGRIR
jgi:iron complex transport system substrate-binding protein